MSPGGGPRWAAQCPPHKPALRTVASENKAILALAWLLFTCPTELPRQTACSGRPVPTLPIWDSLCLASSPVGRLEDNKSAGGLLGRASELLYVKHLEQQLNEVSGFYGG